MTVAIASYRGKRSRGEADSVKDCEVIIFCNIPLQQTQWTLLEYDEIPDEIRRFCEAIGPTFLRERTVYRPDTTRLARELHEEYGPFHNDLFEERRGFDEALTRVEVEYEAQARQDGNVVELDVSGNWLSPIIERGAGLVTELIGDHRILMGLSAV